MALYPLGMSPVAITPAVPAGNEMLTGDIKQPPNTYPPIVPSNFSGYYYPDGWLGPIIPTEPSGIILRTGDKVTTSIRDRILAFGVITSDTTIQVTITNYTLDTLTVSDINLHTLLVSGVSITGLSVLDTIAPNDSITFDVTAFFSVGLSSIRSHLEVVFDSGLSIKYGLLIVRTSSFVYSLEPDADTYSERVLYKTEIVTFSNGREARRSLMDEPKYSVSYSTTAVSNAEIDYGNNVIHLGINNTVYQPIWSQMTKFSAPFSGSILTIDTTDKDFKVGEYVAFLTDPLFPILTRIINVTATQLQVQDPINISGSFIVTPTFTVLPSKSTSFSTRNLRFGKFDFKLEER